MTDDNEKEIVLIKCENNGNIVIKRHNII